MSAPRESRDCQTNPYGPAAPGSGVDRLLGAVAAGDRRAFDLLYGRLHPSVSRLVRLLMRDAALAEEVTQEVFLTVWLGAGRFDPRRGEGSAWVIGIARSRAIDRVRSVHAARQRDQNYAARADVPGVPTPDLVCDRLDGRALREALTVLTPKQRQCVLLAFFGGHTYNEISGLLDVPLPTVKSRIRDGLTRLRVELESTGRARSVRASPGPGWADLSAVLLADFTRADHQRSSRISEIVFSPTSAHRPGVTSAING